MSNRLLMNQTTRNKNLGFPNANASLAENTEDSGVGNPTLAIITEAPHRKQLLKSGSCLLFDK